MTKEVEYNYVTGYPKQVFETLNRQIGDYSFFNEEIKIGITGRNPQVRFNEHLGIKDWDRMVVIYKTTSINFANTLEKWLIDQHFDELINQKSGGGSDLSKDGDNYVYVLLKE